MDLRNTLAQQGHWGLLGYNEEDNLSMMVLQFTLLKAEQVNKALRQHSTTSREEDLQQLEIVVSSGRISSSIMPNDLLLPLWRSLAEKLSSLASSPTSINLCIRDVILPENVLGILEPAFKVTSSLKNMCLCNNNLGRGDGIGFISRVLDANSSIEWMKIMQNNIGCGYDILPLVRSAAKRSPHLQAFTLRESIIDQRNLITAQVISTLFNIDVVDLSGNQLGSHAASVISNCLATNPRVKALDLERNMFSDSDAALFANALKTNSNLVNLDLAKNNFTDVGLQMLYRAIYDDASLGTLCDSNHTCLVGIFDENEPIPNGFDKVAMDMNAMWRTLQETMTIMPGQVYTKFVAAANDDSNTLFCMVQAEGRKKMKMLHAIEGGDLGDHFNTHYLNDLPLGLMPEVFGLIQIASSFSGTEEMSLGRLFQVFRAQPGIASFQSKGRGGGGGIQEKPQIKKRRLV